MKHLYNLLRLSFANNAAPVSNRSHICIPPKAHENASPVGEATLLSLPDLKRRERRFPDGGSSSICFWADAGE